MRARTWSLVLGIVVTTAACGGSDGTVEPTGLVADGELPARPVLGVGETNLPRGVQARALGLETTQLQPPDLRPVDLVATLLGTGASAPVVSNVEAKPNADASRIKALLLQQVTGSVRWIECVQALEQGGVTKVVELGPGKVLCGLVKRISKGIECVNVEDPAGLDKALAAIGS